MDNQEEKSTSVGIDMPVQQARVRKLIEVYNGLEHGAGKLGAALMERALQNADRALASGDIVAILQAYEELKGFEE